MRTSRAAAPREHLHLIGERGERRLEHEVVVGLVDEILQEAVELIARVGVARTPVVAPRTSVAFTRGRPAR